jgi:nucleoside-diphosphate-sugar epimerase
MKVLVTGATGFIGNYVIPALLQRNITVVATSSSRAKAKERSWFSNVTFVEHDIHSYSSENLMEKFGTPDIVIHLAWGALSNFKSEEHIEKVFPAHLNFLKNLIENGLKDLTCTGTCLEYGMQEGQLSEEMESKPTIAYPIAKNRLRQELFLLKEKFNFSLKWVRLFYMYGEGQTPKSILPLLEKALANGDEVFNMSEGMQVRDYLPVSAVSENIIIFALQKKEEGIINCCSNKPITIKELVEDYLRKHHKKIRLNLGYYPYTDYEPMKFWGSDKKLKRILND